MINKRGQVTIFIVIAILIIAVFAIYLTINRGATSTTSDVSSDPVYIFVQDCIEEGGKEAIYEVSDNGGYNYLPELANDLDYPYYYINQTPHVPSKSFIEDELSLYLEGYIKDCVRDFDNFPDLNIRQRDIEVKTLIKENEVVFETNFPIQIMKGEEKIIFQDFGKNIVNARLGALHQSALEFIEQQSNEETICLSCLSKITDEKDIYVEIQDYHNDTLFIFRDERIPINEEFLKFKFANKYLQ